MIGQVISHYQILSERGGGGQGKVYVAEDLHLKRQVAVKFPQMSPGDDQQHARFLREARLAAELNHPHVARIYDYGETEDRRPYLVMELVNGDPLSRCHHKLSMARAVEVMQQVTDALAAAHHLGIIHRDIKPGNIMINDRGEVKVLDFGLAKRVGEPVSITMDSIDLTLPNQLSLPGNIAGTPQYMSPEQASGEQVDARTDLFSLGIVLYECLTGVVPFPGRELSEILMRVRTFDPAPPSKQNPTVPAELDRIVGKALRKSLADRYQTAEELSADLRSVRLTLTDGEAATIRQAPSEPDSRATRVVDTVRKTAKYTVQTVLKKPFIAVPAVLLVLAGLVLLIIFGVSSRLPDPDPRAKQTYDFGVQSLREEAYYRASRALESASASDPNYPLTHLRLADVWLQLDQYDKAKSELLQVTAILPGLQKLSPVESLYHKAINLMVNGRFVDAVQMYRELVSKAPKEEQLHAMLSLGKALEKSGQPKEETKIYLEATKKFDAPSAWLRLATSYARQGQAEEAKRAFDTADKHYDALSDLEGKTEVAYQRGVYDLRRSNIAEAHRDLSRALELAQAFQRVNPNADRSQEILAKLQLGDVASLEKKPDVAAAQVSEALKLAEDNNLERLAARALIKLGNQALIAGHHTPDDDLVTEGYFNRALRISKKNEAGLLEAQSYLGLASLRQQQGRTEEEETYLKNPIDLVAFFSDSGYASEELAARSLVARLVRDSGKYDEAVKAFTYLVQRAKDVSNREYEIRSQIDLVKVLAMKEDYRNAITGGTQSYDMAKSAGLRVLLPYIVADRSDREWKLGFYSDAENTLKELDEDPKPQPQLHAQVLLTRAEMDLSRNQFASAVNYAQAAQKALPDDAETQIHAKQVIGLAKIRQGSVAEGRQLCEEAAKRAEEEKKAWLKDPTILALGEALTAARDPQAVSAARVGAQRFASQGQADSAWRCYLFAALASHQAGDGGSAGSFVKLSREQLGKLESSWPAADYQSYINRPDIKALLGRLNQLENQIK